MSSSPFAIETSCALVALCQPRNGYIQLSSRTPFTQYLDMPQALLDAAKDWAIALETLGSPRVYWIVLSEVVTHYHIHLFPRWPADQQSDTPKGIPLFESRDTAPQPPWTPDVTQALHVWAARHDVAVVFNP